MVLWYAFLAMISAATYQAWRSPVTQLQTAVASTSRCLAYPYSSATVAVKSVRLPNTYDKLKCTNRGTPLRQM
jgi:hypothetical protein